MKLQHYLPPSQPVTVTKTYGKGGGAGTKTQHPAQHSDTAGGVTPGPKLVFDKKHYGNGTVAVRETQQGNMVIQTPGEPDLIIGKDGIVIGAVPEVTSHTTIYGTGGHSVMTPALTGAAWSDFLLVTLFFVGATMLAVKILGLLGRGVSAVFVFLWSVITFPFRVIWGALVFVFTLPARLWRGTKPAAVSAGRMVSNSYEAFAESFNENGGGRAAMQRAREQVRSAREHAIQFAHSGATQRAIAQSKAQFEYAKDRVRMLTQRGASSCSLKRAKRRMNQAGHKLEELSRNLGERLGKLGMDSEAVPAGGGNVYAAASTGTGALPPVRSGRKGLSFPGYKVVSELPRGGSGARLFLAKPQADHARRLAQRGIELPSRVVIKSFSLHTGAHMTGILREGRALDAAKRLGQVLEHFSGDDGLFYVMPYVPGDVLDDYIVKLHGLENGAQPMATEEPLTSAQLHEVLSLQLDLLTELERFHSHGLWHKDVKPGNLIVNKKRLHVVDLGLLTPLASALTLTTHGTEYYRDPEMVRLAMRGAQVRDVDAAKFDLYSAGAVLFSMLEGTFPAHGNLSRLTRPCPPALGWVVRRAMSEHDSRYASARAMREDLAFLLEHKDLDAIKPTHLPSWGKGSAPQPMQAATAPTQWEENDWQAQQWEEHAGSMQADKSVAKKAVAKKRRKRYSLWKVAALALFGGFILKTMETDYAPTSARVSYSSSEMDSRSKMAMPDMSGIPVMPANSVKQFSKGQWGEQRVQQLLGGLQPGEVQQVLVHGLPRLPENEGINRDLDEALANHNIARLDPQAAGVDSQSALAIAVGAAQLLDPLSLTESPDASLVDRFFQEHSEVQAILDVDRALDSDLDPWIVSPTLLRR